MITKIGHIAMNPLDMERSLHFFCDTLGFQKAFELSKDNGEPWIVYVKIAPMQFLELFYGGVRDREEAYDPKRVGYNYLSIETGNIKALSEMLKAKGIDEAKGIEPKDDGAEHLWIRDCDDNVIDFVQREADGTLYKRIAGIAFTTRDMEADLHFYCEQLGLRHIATRHCSECGVVTNVIEVTQGVTIELRSGGVGDNPAPEPVWNARGFQHVCLETDDFDRDVERFISLGVGIDQAPKTGADHSTQTWIHDADSNKVEIMQLSPDSPQAKA